MTQERDEHRPDTRPLALALTAWAGMWLSVSGEVGFWVAGGLGAALLALAAGWRRSWFLAALALVAVVCLASGIGRAVVTSNGVLRQMAAQGAIVQAEVRVDAGRLFVASGAKQDFWVAPATLRSMDGRGSQWLSGARVELAASGPSAREWAEVALGSTVRVSAKLSLPDAGEPAEVVLRAREPPTVIAEPDPVARVVGRLRAGLRSASAGLSPDARGLVPALVVGDISGISEDLTDRFRVTGLTHLTAVSGANLVLMSGFLRALAVALGARGRVLTGVLLGGVLGFVLLCLGEPSVIRAAAMGLVGMAALGRTTGRQGLRYLGTAVLFVLLVDPFMSRSWGFALSVAASFGLLWWAGRWTDLLARWLPRWCAEALAVAMAAQVATEPLVVALSGRVSVVGVLANVIVGPLVGPATVLGLAATLLSVVWLPAAQAAAWLAGWCAQSIAWVARMGDALPGAALPWRATPVTIGLVVVACLVAVTLAPFVLTRPWLCLLLVAAIVVTLLRAPTPPGWPPRAWSVVFCDVGQGDATVIRAGPGQAVVVDTGPDARALARCLNQLGVHSVPMVIFTHGHADHVSGSGALASRGPTQVVGADLEIVAGTTWQVGEATVELIDAPPLAGVALAGDGESPAENDASLLLKVTSGGVSALLAGDAEQTGQQARAALGDRLDVDVLLVPHHGSSSQAPEFIEAARPEVAVFSVGEKNGYGHPTAKTLRLVGQTGALMARTDLQGSVAVSRVAGRLEVTTQR